MNIENMGLLPRLFFKHETNPFFLIDVKWLTGWLINPKSSYDCILVRGTGLKAANHEIGTC